MSEQDRRPAGENLSVSPASTKQSSSHDDLFCAQDLLSLVSQVMPYGKYKGRLIADLPGNYLGWFAREGWPHGELGRLLALMYEIDHNGLHGLLSPLRAKKQDRIGSLSSASSASSLKKMAEVMRAVTDRSAPLKDHEK